MLFGREVSEIGIYIRSQQWQDLRSFKDECNAQMQISGRRQLN